MTRPFDIKQASFLCVLEACHARILEIQKADAKAHMMDVDIPLSFVEHVEDVLMPAIEEVIYWQPTDDQINAPLHA